MRFRNSFRLLIENFKNVYKLLLYKFIISLVAIALCCAFVLPELLAILQNADVKIFMADCEQFFKVVLSLDGGALPVIKEAILGENGSLKMAINVITAQTSRIVLTVVGCVLVFLVKRFVETLGYFTIGSVIDDKMTTYAETSFFTSYIANLGKASAYSLIYVPIAFVFEVGIALLVALMLITLPLLLALFLSMTLIVVTHAIKLTLVGKWMPSMVTDKKTLDEALYRDNKQEQKQTIKIFATYVATMYLIVILNMVAALCTFGSALMITVPASFVFLVCMQFVNYYTVRGRKYFITYDRIATNEDYGDKEHFFEYLEENKK